MHGCTPGGSWSHSSRSSLVAMGICLGSHVFWKVEQTSLFRTKKQIIRRKIMFCLSCNCFEFVQLLLQSLGKHV